MTFEPRRDVTRWPPRRNASAIGLLRLLLGATLALPLLLFIVASWLNYRAAMADGERALRRLSEVFQQHAAKVFDGQNQVIDRVNDLVRGMDKAAIQGAELPLHEAFTRIVARLPQVQSVLLAAGDGQPLVSAGTYPVPTGVNLAGRDYFRAVIDGFSGPYVSSLQVGDVNRQLFFGLARPWIGTDGSRQGVIDVAVQPSFFSDYYRAVSAEEEVEGARGGQVVTLVRNDGQLLVRYPPLPRTPPLAPPTSPFFAAIRANPDGGAYESRSIVDPGAPARLFAYEKVPGYPVYVVVGRTREVIVNEWRETMVSHLMFGLPATLALVGVTWTALVRTRREEQALAIAEQEIARREAAEQALLRAQRLEAVGQMTGGVAHDFNNLLTIILGSAEMMMKRSGDADLVRRFAEQIQLAARRGGEVTHQLLSFSRRQIVRPQTIDLNRQIEEFRPLLARVAPESVRVQFDLDPALHKVRLDPGHFEAAILNLVGNARDAMPQGGRLVIRTRNLVLAGQADLRDGDYVRVAVSDDGTGMDDATIAKAFEPFFTTKATGAGTGLGLSQVYGFTRQAGGDARIVSAVGDGTTVELVLPRAPPDTVDEPAADEAALAIQAGAGEVILVVEDEADLRRMTLESIAELGYGALAAPDAPAALELLRGSQRIDLLFSDVVMPGGINGLQLARQARDVRPALKVLLTSGYIAGGAGNPATDFPLLPKPYDRAQLSAALSNALRQAGQG